MWHIHIMILKKSVAVWVVWKYSVTCFLSIAVLQVTSKKFFKKTSSSVAETIAVVYRAFWCLGFYHVKQLHTSSISSNVGYTRNPNILVFYKWAEVGVSVSLFVPFLPQVFQLGSEPFVRFPVWNLKSAQSSKNVRPSQLYRCEDLLHVSNFCTSLIFVCLFVFDCSSVGTWKVIYSIIICFIPGNINVQCC